MPHAMNKFLLSVSLLISVNSAWSQLFATLPASADCPIVYHDNYNSENQNYGSAAFIAAFEMPGTQGGVNTNRALIAFNLSSIPVGSTVLSAKLNLYAFTDFTIAPFQDGHYGNNQSKLSRIATSWNENSVTWNTQPTVSALNETILNQSTAPNQDYLNINVTALVQDMVDNPNSSFGFRLELVNEVPTANLSFCSSEFSNTAKQPSLVVEYRLPTASVSEMDASQFTLFPNPTAQMLHLRFENSAAKRNFVIYDMQGRAVLLSNAEQQETAIDISNLASGSYTIMVQDATEFFTAKKFVKQ
jgi:hypothetical protein